MARKAYDWEGGAVLEEHTKKKHNILSEYFREYLITRCQLPQMEKFKLAIVDGFSGGGCYSCGAFGSPLIFVDVLIETTNEINLNRKNQGIRPIQIFCLLILNDSDVSAINEVKKNISPLLVKADEVREHLHIDTQYLSGNFEEQYPVIKQRLNSFKCRNVLFNLDQCGYSHVTSIIIMDIMTSWAKAEILLTFMIESMLTYLSRNEGSNNVPLEPVVRGKIKEISGDNLDLNTDQWLGKVEVIAYELLKSCATFVSPFSINNPSGWRYWLMHFSNFYRARQVYNDVLHLQGAAQAHYGRSGLNMLAYDPQDNYQLYLFDTNSRNSAKRDLYEDIPRLVAESGDALLIEDFYSVAYSQTPAHSDDIHEAIMDNPDLEIITEAGGSRRTKNTIKIGDTLKLKDQKSLFFMFPRTTHE